MQKTYDCKYCGREFKSNEGRNGHSKWCDLNPKLYENKSQHSQKMLNCERKHVSLLKQWDLICQKCGKSYTITETQYIIKSGKHKKHCSRTCANGRVHSTVTKQKIRKSCSGKKYPSRTKKRVINCLNCNKETYNKKYCCYQCFKEYHLKTKSQYQKYSYSCKFIFNVFQYPKWFDLNLWNELGLYKATNRGNNLTGVSRDHMYSVKQGFANKVPSQIISHPANCELLPHPLNNKKNAKCSITLDQLYERIQKFNKEYGYV